LRDDKECPLCGNQNYDGKECTLCQYVAPPDELKEPDLEKAKEVDLRQDPGQQQQPWDRHARRNLSNNPFVRRS
jgi:methionyl-tRNA synthetase